jgi:signal transduction histidine kinase
MPSTPPPPDIALRRLVHELNTPVGVSSMAASMLSAHMEHIVAELGEDARKQAEGCLDEFREAVALLQSSLQLCVQILRNSTPLPPTEGPATAPLIDLQATLRSALAMQLARYPDIQVRCVLRFAPGLQVRGDTGVWQQVVGNLVANSLLHGFAGRQEGSIHLSAALLPGNRILVHYCDDGVGLSESVRQQMFVDGFSTRLHAGSSGLGMGIARELVQHHLHGQLQVHPSARGVHISIEAAC